MFNKTLLIVSVTFLFQTTARAQSLPPIQLDRPDQTECPFITPENYIQAESGFNIENVSADRQLLTTPTVLWKYGVNKKFELRFITELITDKNNSDKFTGLAPVTFGFKTALFEEKGIIPKTEENKIPITYGFLRSKISWEKFCDITGIDYYAKKEGYIIEDPEIFYLTESQVKDLF